jgi:hypothetical protein
MWFVSHLIAFLFGALTGGAGHYLGQKFTDQRRRQEANRGRESRFAEVTRAMPELIEEIRNSVAGDPTHLIREIVVLRSPGVGILPSNACFAFYETQHPNLVSKFIQLCNDGFVKDVTKGSVAKYWLTDEFLTLLAK